jgi:phenylalanine-4-hydroxylase
MAWKRVSTTPAPWEVGAAVARLPRHLKQFVVDQRYDRYTAIDHAVWRYIMRQNVSFLRDHAHEAYVEGLRRTGISLEAIPRIEDMNAILARIGWGAVTVDGFIPPAAFMEFQAHKVLVIAADMRQLEHIEYTPAPDIVHEAAGHAPIIADEVYAEYLRRIGEVGSKAISSRRDWELYEAIRRLSILKEAPDSDPSEVAHAEREVEERQANLGQPSEMARLSRLHWWTVEYGLIGDLDDPKIYGAGLLSSIGESANCLTDAVKKLPYTVAAADVAFDITTQQPQLFVTPDFGHLLEVLEEFADTMAFRLGGGEGLERARESGAVATAEYASGLQVSGVISAVTHDGDGRPVYLRTSGPTALAVAGRQLSGHGKDRHGDGFGAPVGRLALEPTPLERMDDSELRRLGVAAGERCTLRFEGGVVVAGRVERVRREGAALVLVTFSDCSVQRDDEVLFQPSWGEYDMAVGEAVASVFAGAADKDAYEQIALVPRDRTVKVELTPEMRELATFYAAIRRVRETGADWDEVPAVWEQLEKGYRRDWLLPLEILELLNAHRRLPELAGEVRAALENHAEDVPEHRKLIRDGLALLDATA